MKLKTKKQSDQEKKILYMAYVWPESTSSAAGLRSWNLLQSFLDKGWAVYCASASVENSFSKSLQEHSIQTQSIQINDSHFDEWIGELQPDYVVFDRFIMEEQYGWRVEKNTPQSVRILDTQDLHFLRKAREKTFHQSKHKEIYNNMEVDFQTEEAKREIASIYRSDLSLLTSNFEKKLLLEKFHIHESLLFYLPLLYNEDHSLEKSIPFSGRKHFCFIGNFQHKPNRDCIYHLRSNIWPKIRERMPNTELHVYGAYMDKAMKHLEDKKTWSLSKRNCS